MMGKTLVAMTALVAVASVATTTRLARAEEQFDVTAAKGQIAVVTKGHWHVNKDYPWKVVVGNKTFDKSKFALTETSAIVSGVPQGAAKLKGAVCEGTQCLPFSKDLTVQ